MFSMRILATLAILGGTLTLADAQQRQPGKGGLPGGGTGGAPAALPGPVDRLKNKSVAEDLKISQEQLEKLKAWSEGYQARVQAAIQAETYRQLGEVLTPEQVKRLKQIEIQAAGLRAFSMAEVSAALKLSEEQQARLKTLRDETGTASREAFSGLFGGGRPSEEKIAEARKKSQAAIAEGMNKAMAVLSDEQKSIWKSLLGEPFDTSTLQPAGFGRPGGTTPGAVRPKD